MTYDEKRSLYESIMKKIAVEVKRQINEMSPDVYVDAAFKRHQQGNKEAEDKLLAHADEMSNRLKNAIYENDINYIQRNYPDTLYVKNGLICVDVTVFDENDKNHSVCFAAKNIKNVLMKVCAFYQASVANITKRFFKIKVSKNLKLLWKVYVYSMTEKESDKLDKLIDSLYYSVYINARTIDELTNNLKHFNFRF